MSSENPSPSSRVPATLRALRHRNFQLFFGGQLISLIGTWMQSIAEAWLVYRLTGSSVLLGTISFANQIPVFLVAPLGGIVADRWSRRKIVIGTQAASMLLALTLSLLTLTGMIRVWHLFVLTALLGVVNSFDIPARQAFLSDMVGREDLMNAIALNSSMFNSARIVGPAVAGILVANIGEGWCFFANGVSYIAVIAGLLMMDVRRHIPVGSNGSMIAHVVEGFRFVIHNLPIHALLILLGILSLTGMPFAVLMPIFADQILHGGARGLGLLMGASGIGALCGALTLATRQSVRGLSRWVAMSAGAFGATLAVFALSRSFWFSCAVLIPVGFAMMIEMGSSNTLIQSMSPDHLRGRVMSVYSMMFMGMSPIGALLSGICAEKFGAPLTVAAGGVICIVAATVFGLNLPALRISARRLIVAQQLAGGDPPQEIVTAGIPVPPAKE
ncbi:MAG TPA: MFS transporter [Bryobacteraceae bacterium]|nr:MFS transporter [Bryobacteraceae bacterium]